MTEETMIDWLEVKLRRAPGQCRDEAERKMGMNKVKLTLARIRYLRDVEAQHHFPFRIAILICRFLFKRLRRRSARSDASA